MILIADSGSTKTDWTFCANTKIVKHIQGEGFNPNYLPIERLSKQIREIILNEPLLSSPTNIYFYGSGCKADTNVAQVKTCFQELFPNSEIEIYHDLLGAARSCCGKTAGVVAILGTGSNACLFNGKEIIENPRSLGWIFGDFGSGVDIGKAFMTTYLEESCPDHIKRSFEAKHNLTIEKAISEIYGAKQIGKLLSQFTYFVKENIEDPFLEKIVKDSFSRFFKSSILPIKDAKGAPVHFIGSIAFAFLPQLEAVAKTFDITISNVYKTPSEGLINYHLNNQ